MNQALEQITPTGSPTECPGFPQDWLHPAVIIGGEPWWNLRDVLKATGHRPSFIRQGLLSVEAVRRFMQRSDKSEASALLAQITTLA